MYYRFVLLFNLLCHRYFTYLFAVLNRKLICIIETVEQIGRYLIRYSVVVFCNLG